MKFASSPHSLAGAELARAKEKFLGAQGIPQSSNDSSASLHALDELYGLRFAHYRTLRAQMKAVTLEEVRRVAREYFLDQPAITAIVRPRNRHSLRNGSWCIQMNTEHHHMPVVSRRFFRSLLRLFHSVRVSHRLGKRARQC